MMLFTSFSHDETDEQLMERFAFRNSEKAFEELYCRYAPRFKGFFMRMLSADGALRMIFCKSCFFVFMRQEVVISMENSSLHGRLRWRIIFAKMSTAIVI